MFLVNMPRLISLVGLAIVITNNVCIAWDSMPDSTDDEFQDDCINTSNDYRATHHSPPLEMDPDAVEYAKSRCALISQEKELDHGHAGLEGYGENLSWEANGEERTGTCKDAINEWYAESDGYDYDAGYQKGRGHFSQLVWKDTTLVGCARCSGIMPYDDRYTQTYVVCNYKPAGNVQLDGDPDKFFLENVLRP